MASVSQVVVLRLRSGGVLLIAPAAVLPWPRVVGRKLRRLQEDGVHRALADPQAMARLRRELPRLTDLPHIRGAQPDSDTALARAILQGARSGRLTLMFGPGETGLRNGRAGELPDLFAAHPVVDDAARRLREPSLDSKEGLPDHTAPLPSLFLDRMRWVCGRAPHFMQPDVALPMREFFAPGPLPITTVLLKTWANTQESGAGFTVDAAMFATAVWDLGHEAGVVFSDLADAFRFTRAAASWPSLDDGAQALASAVARMRPPLLRQFLRRIGEGTGATQSSGGSGESARSAAPDPSRSVTA